MDQFTFLLTLGLLSLCYLAMGYYNQNQSRSEEDFLLSSRKVGGWALGMSILATQLGGGTLMGAAQEAARSGPLVLFYPLGGTLGLLALAYGLGEQWHRLKLCTISELFERVYQSPLLRKISAALSILSLFLLLVGQGIAARLFLQSLGIDSPLVFWGFWIVLITYTVVGGLSAVIQTDILQAGFILVSLAITALAVIFSSKTQAPLLAEQALVANIESTPRTIPWVQWLLLPFLFMLIEQDMGQRCFAARSGRSVSRASLFAAVAFFVTTLFPIWIGYKAATEGILETMPKGGSILLHAVSFWCSPQLSAVFACAILMAIISTADSLLCSITSNISFDFPMLGRPKGSAFKQSELLLEKRKVQLAQGSTLIIGLLAMFVSSYAESVIEVLMLAYELSVVILLVPILAATYSKKLPAIAAWSSMATGALLYAICTLYGAPAVLTALPPSLLVFMVALKVTQGAKSD